MNQQYILNKMSFNRNILNRAIYLLVDENVVTRGS